MPSFHFDGGRGLSLGRREGGPPAGNSEAVIRKHYLDLKSVEEADEFWKIVPEGEKLPKLEKKDGRYLALTAMVS